MVSKTSSQWAATVKAGSLVAILLFVVLSALFHNSYLPGWTLFSNDGPLGALMAQCRALPASFLGGWNDLNTIGFREGGAYPDVTYCLLFFLGPVAFSKCYAPFALFVLGLGAWCFFRQLKLAPLACVLGALAATLNSAFFSTACWGMSPHPIAVGMSFFALAALANTDSRRRWLRVLVAGLAVGIGVSEGADVGAIFSIYVAIFICYQALVSEGPVFKNATRGVFRVAIVAMFAALVAAQTISVLIGTQIQNVVGTQQDTRTKGERWDFSTQWSLPKREALQFIIPGLYGYRMDSSQRGLEGGDYWGAVGRDPAWDRYFASGQQGQPPAGRSMRFNGGGCYAGVLVVLLAAWAAFQAFQKEQSVYTPMQRKFVKFWLGAAIVSLLFAFGRFAPFYQILYALPYFSTIRNPTKFLGPTSWSLVVLFAYGVHGLSRRYLEAAAVRANSLPAQAKGWWSRITGGDRKWTMGCGVVMGVSVIGCLMYANWRPGLETYLQGVGIDAATAKLAAGFSVREAGLFIVDLALAIGLVTAVLSGTFAGPRAKWAGWLLGLFLVIDLGHANQPWIIYWNYPEKYASNPVLDFLREKPYEHRVANLPVLFRLPPEQAELESRFEGLYGIEWIQQLFQYYSIQSIDLVQMPRMPEDLEAFERTLRPVNNETVGRMTRRWELTNTRYLLGAVDFIEGLNQFLDPEKHRFRIAGRFDVVPKPGVTRITQFEQFTVAPSTNGAIALFEFTGALPRAKLYLNWQTSTNDQATLEKLASTTFDPAQTVLVAEALPAADGSSATNRNPGSVQYVSYAPKRILLQASAAGPSVLLLNDHFDPNWRVKVDGKPATLLRCNYLMRGVQVPAGEHKVEFQFLPATNGLYVSLAAILFGLAVTGFVVFSGGEPDPDPKVPERPAQKKAPALSLAENSKARR